jgi:hypothetical protein
MLKDVNTIGESLKELSQRFKRQEQDTTLQRQALERRIDQNKMEFERLTQEIEKTRTSINGLPTAQSIGIGEYTKRIGSFKSTLERQQQEQEERTLLQTNLEQKLEGLRSGREDYAKRLFIQGVERFASSENRTRAANTVAGTIGIRQRAIQETLNGKPFSYFNQLAQQIDVQERETVEKLMADVKVKKPEEVVEQYSGRLTELTQQKAFAISGMRAYEQMRRDPYHKYLENEASVSKILNYERKAEQIEEIKASKTNLDDIQDVIKKTTTAFEELQKQLKEGKISLEEFNNVAEQNVERYEKAKQTERVYEDVRAQKMGQYTDWLRTGSSMLSTAASTVQDVGINIPIQLANVRANLAGASNQQFETYRRAVGLDVHSMMMIQGMGQAADFQKSMYGRQQGVLGTQIGSQGLGIFGEVAKAFASRGTSLPGGIANISGAVGNIVSAEERLRTGVTAATTGQEAYYAKLGEIAEITKVPAFFIQSAVDYGMNVTRMTRGAGAGRGSYNNTMENPMFLKELGDSFINPDRFLNLANQALVQQGADVATPEQIRRQAFQARRFEVGGFGSMEQVAGWHGQLATANIKDPNAVLGKIMEDAVMRGFDNSKAVEKMVDATTSIAESSGLAAFGVNTGGGISARVADVMGERDLSRSVQGQVRSAMTTTQTLDALAKDRSMSYVTMQKYAAINAITGDPRTTNVAMNLTPTQLSVIREAYAGTDKDARANAANMIAGLGLTTPTGNLNLEKFSRLERAILDPLALGGAGGTGLLYGKSREQVRDIMAFANKNKVSNWSQLEELVQKDTALKTRWGGEGGTLQYMGQVPKNVTGNIATDVMQYWQGIYGSGKFQDQGRRAAVDAVNSADLGAASAERGVESSAKILTTEIAVGQRLIGSLEKFEKATESRFKDIPANMEKFATAAAEAADALKMPEGTKAMFDQFSAGLTSANTALDKFAVKLNEVAGVKKPPTNEIRDSFQNRAKL